MLNLSSLSTQSLASCVNYFVWNCFKCFSNTKIGSVTSFSILFNFQGPVSASANRLTTWLFYHRSDFLSSSFLEAFELSELGPLRVSQNKLESFSVYWFFSSASLLGLQKSFFCLSAWHSSIIPHAGAFGKPFFRFFCCFFRLCFFLLVFFHISSLNWRASFFFLFSGHFPYIM